MKQLLRLSLGLLSLLLSTCHPPDFEPVSPKVDAWFEVLDLKGKRRTVFREGEDFQFSLSIRNRRSEAVRMDIWDFPIWTNFFLVLRQEDNPRRTVVVGKPFDGSGTGLDGRTQVVPPNSQITYRLRWQTRRGVLYEMPTYSGNQGTNLRRFYSRVRPEEGPLPRGRYCSNFSILIDDKPVSFSASFRVE